MNKGKKVNVQQYITRREEIKVRLNEIVDLAESETNVRLPILRMTRSSV